MARQLSNASREWLRRSLDDRVRIDSFDVDVPEIEFGGEVCLRWSVANAEEVQIGPYLGDVPAEGSQRVRPLYSTEYTLAARGRSGVFRRRLRVTVRPIDLVEPPQLVRDSAHLLGHSLQLVAVGEARSLRSRLLDWLRGLIR